MEYDVHRLDNILFHPFGVSQSAIYFLDGLASLRDTSIVLFFELLEHPTFMLVDDFVEVAIVLFYFNFFFLVHLKSLGDVGVE